MGSDRGLGCKLRFIKISQWPDKTGVVHLGVCEKT